MVGASRLSVVMPMYNLAGSVKKNLLKTAELYEEKRLRVQLVPVDDGSSDGTGGEIEEFLFENMGVWKYVQVTPVILKKNGGKGP